jgi:hypothetical protein
MHCTARLVATIASLALLALTACERADAPHSLEDFPLEATAHPAADKLVATQATIPDEREDEFADFAVNHRQLRAAWQRFRMRGELPEVDFRRSALVFVGFGESGRCPATLDAVAVRGNAIMITMGPNDGAVCTADYNPRTFVVTVPRQDMPRGEFTVDLDGDQSFTLAGRSPTPPTQPTVVQLLTSEPIELAAIAQPTSAIRGGTVEVVLRNDGTVAVSTGGWGMSLLTWDGRRWADARDQPRFGDHTAITWEPVMVRPGQRRVIATVDTSDLPQGWYSLHTKLQVSRSGGAVEIERPFEVSAAP